MVVFYLEGSVVFFYKRMQLPVPKVCNFVQYRICKIANAMHAGSLHPKSKYLFFPFETLFSLTSIVT